MDANAMQNVRPSGMGAANARPNTRIENIDARLGTVVGRLAVVSAQFKEMGDKLVGAQPEPVSAGRPGASAHCLLASIDERIAELEMLADHFDAHQARFSGL